MTDEGHGDDFHWTGPLPAPDFIMVPKLVHQRVLRHLSGAEFKVFYCLLVFAYEWGRPQAELSISQLVELAGVGRGTAQAATKRLEAVGLIAVQHHDSTAHGHEANTYRVMVTDDPRYVDRAPIPKTGTAGGQNRDSSPEGRDRSRVRSFTDKNHSKNPPTPIQNDPARYSTGAYALCPGCGTNQCPPDCSVQARSAAG